MKLVNLHTFEIQLASFIKELTFVKIGRLGRVSSAILMSSCSKENTDGSQLSCISCKYLIFLLYHI